MRVVLDTNCLLRCVGKKSPYRNVFDAFLQKRYLLCASTDRLLEYEERFISFWGSDVAENLMGLFQYSPDLAKITVSFNWLLISKEEDDNKFVDCYVAANADYLVSNDSAVTHLKGTPFPPLTILTLEEFSRFLSEA